MRVVRLAYSTLNSDDFEKRVNDVLTFHTTGEQKDWELIDVKYQLQETDIYRYQCAMLIFETHSLKGAK